MQQVNSGTAYIVWCLCLLGICGGQRFYTGNIASGLVYLFTFGVFGIGQLLDLVLIPGMVDRRNIYLRGLGGGNATASVNQSITLNLGDIPLNQLQVTQSPVSASGTPMQRLLRAAKENGGTLSIAQAAMHTELEAQEVKQLLQEAEKNGFAEITNDPNSGAIRYRFDV
jgi:TM2 domain-containing membrane protein YozV